MNCSNCGNLVAPGEVCVTCGTVAPAAEPHTDSGVFHEPVTAGATQQRSMVGIVIGAVALVAIGVLAGAFLFRSGSTVDTAEPTVTTTPAAAATVPATGAPATSTPAAGAEDWMPAIITGTSLTAFENPDSDRSVGEPALTVHGFDFAGAPVSIEDNGSPKVLVFLAHWCPHCQREVPAVQEYVDTVGVPDGVELISIATSISPEQSNYPPDAWLESEGWTAPVIVDPDNTIAEAYGLRAFPYYVFIREDFTVDFRIAGELNPQPVFEYTTTLFGPGPDRVAIGPSNYEEAAVQATACGGSQPDAPLALGFDEPGQAPEGSVLTFVTSCGDIEIELDSDIAPETVASMLFLADQGYFDGTVCHRLIPGFVLQCGDPTATGVGSPGYRVPDEFPEDSTAYQVGTVAMANAGPGTTGSQFFVVLGDASFLPPQFTVIGQVTNVESLIAALDTVPLGLSGTGETSAPLETIYIESAVISDGP